MRFLIYIMFSCVLSISLLFKKSKGTATVFFTISKFSISKGNYFMTSDCLSLSQLLIAVRNVWGQRIHSLKR